jgi:hypothetical protein
MPPRPVIDAIGSSGNACVEARFAEVRSTAGSGNLLLTLTG